MLLRKMKVKMNSLNKIWEKKRYSLEIKILYNRNRQNKIKTENNDKSDETVGDSIKTDGQDKDREPEKRIEQ